MDANQSWVGNSSDSDTLPSHSVVQKKSVETRAAGLMSPGCVKPVFIRLKTPVGLITQIARYIFDVLDFPPAPAVPINQEGSNGDIYHALCTPADRLITPSVKRTSPMKMPSPSDAEFHIAILVSTRGENAGATWVKKSVWSWNFICASLLRNCRLTTLQWPSYTQVPWQHFRIKWSCGHMMYRMCATPRNGTKGRHSFQGFCQLGIQHNRS